jgi:hypothetical protein
MMPLQAYEVAEIGRPRRRGWLGAACFLLGALSLLALIMMGA